MSPKKQYVIGIDGGGTKTAALLADMNGAVLAEATGGPSNFQMIGVDKAAEVLLGLVVDCLRKVQGEFEDIACVVAGLTGAGRQTDKDRMREGLRFYADQNGRKLGLTIIESDARIALEGAFAGKPGIILIAGTGSIAFAKDVEGVIHRVGGWGRTLGDEGSGYAIGRNGLNAVTNDLDGRGRHTKLTTLVAERFGLVNQERIIAAVYRENFDIASIAPLVLEAASKRDPVCVSLVRAAAVELSAHVRAMIPRVNSLRRKKNQKIPLSLIGSLAGGNNLLSKTLRRQISATLKQIAVISPKSSPPYGAVLMALEAHRVNAP